MREALIALSLLVGGVARAQPAADPPRSESPYQLTLAIDLPLLIIGPIVWISPFAIVTPELAKPPCDPCDPQNINVIDRQFVNFHEKWAAYTGDALFYALPPFFITLEMIDYGGHAWRG